MVVMVSMVVHVAESLKAVATAANGRGTFWTKIYAILSDLFICRESRTLNSIFKYICQQEHTS